MRLIRICRHHGPGTTAQAPGDAAHGPGTRHQVGEHQVGEHQVGEHQVGEHRHQGGEHRHQGGEHLVNCELQLFPAPINCELQLFPAPINCELQLFPAPVFVYRHANTGAGDIQTQTRIKARGGSCARNPCGHQAPGPGRAGGGH